MKNHTTMKVGGPSDVYVEADNIEVLSYVIDFSKKNDIPFFLIGNGSNLLVSDEGFRGIITKLTGEFCNISKKSDDIISCGSGAKLFDICKFALDNSLSGLEFSYGIPGTCGGAVYMNAGAYGGEIRNIVEKVKYIDMNLNEGEIFQKECEFAYRESLFSKKNMIIISADFRLKESTYDEVKEKMDDFINRRITKQPLDFPSSGSTFKRPKGHFVGPMIEKCGLKGFSIGGASVSEKHAGFVINKGDASCNDVLELIKKIQKEVEKKFKVKLEVEPVYLSNK